MNVKIDNKKGSLTESLGITRDPQAILDDANDILKKDL